MWWIRGALFSLSFLGGVALTPWIPAIGIIALTLRWRAYEALLLALVTDFLWLPVGSLPLFTIGAVALLWAFDPIRREFLT